MMNRPTVGFTDPMARNYHRVLAEEIRPGMKVARARTHNFREVAEVRQGNSAVTIYYVHPLHPGSGYGGYDRPRKDAKWWMEMEADDDGQQ